MKRVLLVSVAILFASIWFGAESVNAQTQQITVTRQLISAYSLTNKSTEPLRWAPVGNYRQK